MNDPNVEGARQSALVGKVSLVNMGEGVSGGLLVMLMWQANNGICSVL